MRNVLVGLVLVGLLAAPSLGVMNLQLVANGSTGTVNVLRGSTVTITIQFQGSTKAVGQLGGSITGTPQVGVAVTTNNDFLWAPKFTAAINPVSGTPAADGGMNSFGSAQPTPSDTTFGLAPSWASVATYTVLIAPGSLLGKDVLHFVPAIVGGYGPMKSVATPTIDSTIGTISDVTLNVIPEPATMAMLAIGGLLLARRRR